MMETVKHFLKKMSVLVTFFLLFSCIDQHSASDDKEIVTHPVECYIVYSEIDCIDDKQNQFRNYNEIPETTNFLILRNVKENEFHLPPLKNLMSVTQLALIEKIPGSITFSQEYLQNLDSLTISYEWFHKNDLSNVTLRLPKLKNLTLTLNSQMDLPFDFYCSFPHLENLSIRLAFDLLHLPCGENSSCCSHLQSIEIDVNDVSKNQNLRVALDAFRNLPNMEVLILGPLTIINSSNVSVNNFPKLKFLQLFIDYEHLDSLIHLRSLTRLRVQGLTQDRQKISLDFEFSNLPQLETLDIRHYGIENVSSSSFKNCSNLILLDLSYNRISSLTNRDESGNVRNIFTSDRLPHLEYLILARNGIQHLDYSMIPESVKVLDLSDNPLSSFSGNETSCRNHALKQLYANCDLIMDLEHICFPPTIELISLEFSNIHDFPEKPFSSLNNLKELLLHGNNLLKLDQSALSSNYRSRFPVNIIVESCLCKKFHKPIRNLSLVININHQLVHMCQYMSTCGDARTKYETTTILYCNSWMWKEFPSTSQEDSNEIYLDENNQTTVNFDLILQRYSDLNVLYINKSNIHRIEMTDEHRHNVSTSLREIHLQDNFLEFLPKYFFTKLRNSSSLHLQRNSLKHLEIIINTETHLDDLHFENNSISEFVVESQFFLTINTVYLQFNEFSKINDSFCDNILTLHLENNKISEVHFFSQHPSILEKLYLQNNHLTVLNSHTFGRSIYLNDLNLEGNRIREIDNWAFDYLYGLKRLNLGRNRIEEIDEEIFYDVYNLEVLNLEENSLVGMPPLVFKNLKKLQTLHLNRNRITTLSLDLFENNKELKELHLEENNIGRIDLSVFENLHSLVYLHLNNNNISEIKSHPTLDLLSLQELHLNDNQLKVINAKEFKGMKKLTKLFLHHNEIHQIDKDSFKDLTSLEILTLHKNKLKQPEIWNFGLSSNIKNLTIHQNQFLCELEYIKQLRKFFTSINFISNRSEIKCLTNENEEFPIDGLDDYFLQFKNKLIIGLSVSIGLLLLIVSVSVLLYKYRLAIQVLLYSRFKVRFFYDKSLDEGKQYDAFVAYSYEDRAFVAHELVPRLEDYRLCIHDRDFVVGLFIQENIIKAVKHSCCTLMIFSNSFARSQWCKYEFRTAYERTLKDRWRRILVILMEDINEDDLEDEMIFYLSTTTYLRWGDPLFWEKLYYALPSPMQSDRERNHRLQDIPLQELTDT